MDSPEAATTLLECFALTPDPPPLVPADPSRAWMDRVPGRHAYRCLPMAIANTYGWEVRSPCKFEVEWNGGERQADLTFRALDGFALMSHLLHSNFAQGILTFHTGYMFRTPPGWNLMASGPLNAPKHGIAPLAGVIETDWLPYPFTMNWKMTFPGIVTFEKDEPFCLIYPVRQGTLERFTPVIRDLNSAPELKGQYEAWRDSRSEFMERYTRQDPATMKEAWQKHYFKGEYPQSDVKPEAHQNKLRLEAPVDRRRK